jgi:hypothetical protein
MNLFENREREFEARFKYDEELRFKVMARRNKLLGLWASHQMGLVGDELEAYAKQLVAAEFEPGGDQHLVRKLADDLTSKGEQLTLAQITFQLEHFAEEAKRQLIRE